MLLWVDSGVDERLETLTLSFYQVLIALARGLCRMQTWCANRGLSGGGDGPERTGLSCNLDDRSDVPLEQRAFGAGVSARGALGARVVSAPISSPTRTRSSTE